MTKPLTKGTTCKCGKFTPFHMWVYAHWDEELYNTCECGVETVVQRGRVIKQIGKPKKMEPTAAELADAIGKEMIQNLRTNVAEDKRRRKNVQA